MSAEANSTTSETELVKQPPEFAKRVLTTVQKRLPNFRLGQEGEDAACKYLQTRNYQIIEQNLIIGQHEIDIIALDQTNLELVFIEVKNRQNSRFGHPSQAVNSKKLRGLAAAARSYLRKYPSQLDYRFDIISITANRVEHFENISWNY